MIFDDLNQLPTCWLHLTPLGADAALSRLWKYVINLSQLKVHGTPRIHPE
jgi:hypothetical protein